MKKICLLLILLSGISFAETKQNDVVCKQQELGGCETLYICQNGVSLIVKKEINKRGSGCFDEIVTKYVIDTKEQKLVEIPNKK